MTKTIKVYKEINKKDSKVVHGKDKLRLMTDTR